MVSEALITYNSTCYQECGIGTEKQPTKGDDAREGV